MSVPSLHRGRTPSQIETPIERTTEPNDRDPLAIAQSILSFVYPSPSLLQLTGNPLSQDLARIPSRLVTPPPKPTNEELLGLAKKHLYSTHAVLEYSCQEVLANNPNIQQITEALSLLCTSYHYEASCKRIDQDTLCRNRIDCLQIVLTLDHHQLRWGAHKLVDVLQQLAKSYAWLGHYEEEALCINRILTVAPLGYYMSMLRFNQGFLARCEQVSLALWEFSSEMPFMLQDFCAFCAKEHNIDDLLTKDFSPIAEELCQKIDSLTANSISLYEVRAHVRKVLHEFEKSSRSVDEGMSSSAQSTTF